MELWTKIRRILSLQRAMDGEEQFQIKPSRSEPEILTPFAGRIRSDIAFSNLSCDELLTSELPVQFHCNICGKESVAAVNIVCNREASSCIHCQSSLRMRSLIHILSLELFGEALLLPDFPETKNIVGMGMSDWDGYAKPLSEKLNYTNTYYDKEPKLDITKLDDCHKDRYDFIIASDVFEHVPHPVSNAFSNAYNMLKPGGLFIFTAPYRGHGLTREYYPDLFDFEIEKMQNETVLVNKTADGLRQVFRNLVFHGGDGFTLEMRMFTETSLIQEFEKCKFCSFRIQKHFVPQYGIVWPMDWALPMTVRK